LEQISPVTTHIGDGFAQTPLLQKPDAQFELTEHGLPLVGFGPSGLHVPPPVPFGAHV
jgi:hypothetical protein